jgi:hypothetical protein
LVISLKDVLIVMDLVNHTGTLKRLERVPPFRTWCSFGFFAGFHKRWMCSLFVDSAYVSSPLYVDDPIFVGLLLTIDSCGFFTRL